LFGLETIKLIKTHFQVCFIRLLTAVPDIIPLISHLLSWLWSWLYWFV